MRETHFVFVGIYVGLGTSCTAHKKGATWWEECFSYDLIGGYVVLVLHCILYDIIIAKVAKLYVMVFSTGRRLPIDSQYSYI